MSSPLVIFLTAILLGQVERASDRLTHKVWWRIPIFLIIVGAAAWVAVASAWLWTSASHPGMMGLVDVVQHGGGPAWLLSIPVVALLIVVVGCLPVAGRYGLVFVLQTALFWLVLLGLATFQANGRAALNAAAVSSMLATMPATLLALVTALADTPPIESPLAYFTMMYIGRVHHLRGLLASARRLGWEVTGPAGIERVLTIGGYYGGRRDARVVSGVIWQGVSAWDQGFYYEVTVTSPRELPAFQVGRQKLPRALAARAVTRIAVGRGAPLRCSVIPRPDHQIGDAWMRRFVGHVTEGRRYLRTRRQSVQLAEDGVLYRHFSRMRLPARSGEIEPLLDWLIGLAGLLEEIALPAEQLDPCAAYESDGY